MLAISQRAQANQTTHRYSQLIPLVITIAILAGGAWVGWHIYLSVTAIRDSASERMGKKNVVFTKDGVRVGVKHVQQEKYVDATQSWVVKAWNLGETREDEDL